MAKVLVTGGAGFIGSHLVESLLKRNDSVPVLDDFSTGKRENLTDLQGVDILEGDLNDLVIVSPAVQNVEGMRQQ